MRRRCVSGAAAGWPRKVVDPFYNCLVGARVNGAAAEWPRKVVDPFYSCLVGARVNGAAAEWPRKAPCRWGTAGV